MKVNIYLIAWGRLEEIHRRKFQYTAQLSLIILELVVS